MNTEQAITYIHPENLINALSKAARERALSLLSSVILLRDADELSARLQPALAEAAVSLKDAVAAREAAAAECERLDRLVGDLGREMSITAIHDSSGRERDQRTILQEQIENVYLRRIVTELKGDIEGGNSLSSSFAKHPNVFPAIFSNMIKAGESSGSLNEILERVADYLERTEGVKHKLKSALTYPALIIGMAIIIVGFLILKVVPAFKNIFESLGGSLPLPTLFLIQFSNLSIRLFPLIVIASIIIVAAFKRYVSTETGRLRFDQFKLKIPIFGPVLRNMAISKFTRTLATLVKSGVSILEAFEIAGKVAGNKIIEQATYQIRVDLQAGESISEPMAQTGKFPVFVVKMIAVGEQTGELEKMLSKVSDYYEEQINEALNSLTAMLEPVIILFLGSVIGFIVLAMFLPIFKLTQTIAH